MKKYINFIGFIEVLFYFIVVSILINLDLDRHIEDAIGICFSLIYWVSVLIFNISYHTVNFIKKSRTPKVPLCSPTAWCAYWTFFLIIKNNSYREFIKSANDYKKMTKKQKIQSYLYYLFYYLAVILFILHFYFEDYSEMTILSDMLLLLGLLLLLVRAFMLYGFGNKKGVKNE